MPDYLKKLASVLTEEDKEFLKKIYEPVAVAIPPSDAYNSLCVTDDGEIRCYGTLPTGLSPNDPKEPVYISSADCGLSWKMHKASPEEVGSCVKSPYSGRWLAPFLKDGQLYVRISEKGAGSTEFKEVKVGENSLDYRLPLALKSIKRWIIAANYKGHSAVYISDDDGESWHISELSPTDRFVMAPPHKGMRWENSGVEPTVLEMKDGSLIAVLRTSTDYHYISRSFDYGESWSKPVPTTFHSTLTNPCLLRLNDGRILFFYNNTRPLPEMELENVWPPLSEDEKNGVWEDVFTNRDSNCVAVSEDEGKTWQGFRELYLNELRNDCDFRSSGSNATGRDKSVHQFQAIELPFSKIMVQVGQHTLVRKIVIFDIGWLYEKKRSENFRCGMGSLSTQVYLKSVSGCYRDFSGHCAWNRTNGAVPVPDPSGDHTEAVLIRNTDDDRLFSNTQGIVWNFPASRRGNVRIDMFIMGNGIRVSLLDHWINPVDMTVSRYAQFTAELMKTDIHGSEIAEFSGYTVVIFSFDVNTGKAVVTADGSVVCEKTMNGKAPNGICYLHIQTLEINDDKFGTLIKRLDFSATD